MTTIQWVFSGIGVLIVGWLATWAYRRFANRSNQENSAPAQIISGSTVVGPVAGRDINIKTFHAGSAGAAVDEYRAAPTPFQIKKTISGAPIYTRDTIANNYADLKVRWSGTLYTVSKRENDEILAVVQVEEGQAEAWVRTIVKLDDYPVLKIVHGGEPVTIAGTIASVEGGIITLKGARLTFD